MLNTYHALHCTWCEVKLTKLTRLSVEKYVHAVNLNSVETFVFFTSSILHGAQDTSICVGMIKILLISSVINIVSTAFCKLQSSDRPVAKKHHE